MPEGDTIYRAARALNKALAGRIVTAFQTGVAKLARVNDDTPLVGRVVERVESRGKWCLLYFSGDLILVTHMLMNGSWHLYRPGERWRLRRTNMRVAITVGTIVDNESRPSLTTENSPAAWEAVLFNAQIAEFHTTRSLERSSQIPKLGPDLLADNFTAESGTARLQEYARKHPDAEIGVVLLNQRVLAGLGNVYKSEVAFAAGVNPWRPMRTLTPSEIQKMVDYSMRYMRANVIDGKGDGIVTYAGHRRTTHSMSKEERLWVYGRQDQECRRCGTTIMMQKQGEQARVTFWCPHCQPWLLSDVI